MKSKNRQISSIIEYLELLGIFDSQPDIEAYLNYRARRQRGESLLTHDSAWVDECDGRIASFRDNAISIKRKLLQGAHRASEQASTESARVSTHVRELRVALEAQQSRLVQYFARPESGDAAQIGAKILGLQEVIRIAEERILPQAKTEDEGRSKAHAAAAEELRAEEKFHGDMGRLLAELAPLS